MATRSEITQFLGQHLSEAELERFFDEMNLYLMYLDQQSLAFFLQNSRENGFEAALK